MFKRAGSSTGGSKVFLPGPTICRSAQAITDASDKALPGLALLLMSAEHESTWSHEYMNEDQCRYFGLLVVLGYKPSDVEKEQHQHWAARHAR